MLGLGQYVDVIDEPTRGWLDFDRETIGTCDWISGTRMFRGKRCYQLANEDAGCWWTEDALRKTLDLSIESTPTYDLGDEVRCNKTSRTGKVTSVIVYQGTFEYELDYEGPYIPESNLTPHGEKYTLF